MSVRISTATTRLGLATFGIIVALAAMSQPSVAQDGGKPASTPPAPGDAAAKIAKGRTLFADYGCGSCHALADAGATGRVGPSFDGDTSLTEAFVINRVTNGQGAMPAFGGQLSDEEIGDIAAYLTHVATK